MLDAISQKRTILIVALIALVMSPGWLPVVFPYLREVLLAIFGTFVGAYAAFSLEQRARDADKRAARAAEGNLALLTIMQMWQVQHQYKVEVIDRAPVGDGRWLNFSTTVPEEPPSLRFDPNKLYFLFEGEDKNLLPLLLLEERRFHSAMTLINRRSSLMLDRVWPALSAHQVRIGSRFTEDFIISVIGAGSFREAQELTEAITRNVSENVECLKKTYFKLRKQLIEVLPASKFIGIDFEATPEEL